MNHFLCHFRCWCSSCSLLCGEQERSRRPPSASHWVGRHLEPLDNNGLETTHSEATAELFSALEMEGVVGVCVAGGSHGQPPPFPHHLFFPPKESKNKANHLTHFHPISTAECVHFGANGMSFCRSLWSRINPGIKTDFPGSNLPSSIDFFTLTEPVLPNLT